MALWCALTLLTACGGHRRPAVEDIAGREDLSRFALESLRGTRDGDRLEAEARFSDGSSVLTLELRFAVGAPTTLSSGAWRWPRDGGVLSGAATARSVTFLGGQSGPPSIGGVFELLGAKGPARFRVTIPVTELRVPFRREGERPAQRKFR